MRLFITVCALFASLASYAGIYDFTSSIQIRLQNHTEEFLVKSSTNALSEREIEVSYIEKRTFLPNTRIPILWGRDLNQDGRFDIWFYQDGQSGLLKSKEYNSRAVDGSDAIKYLIQNEIELGNRFLIGIIFKKITQFITLTQGVHQSKMSSLSYESMNILDLEARATSILKNNESTNQSRKEALKLLGICAEAWTDMYKQLGAPAYKTLFFSAVGDLGLYLTGAVIFRGLGVLIEKGIAKLGTTALAVSLKEFYLSTIKMSLDRANLLWKKIENAGGSITVSLPSMHLASLTAQQSVKFWITEIESRGMLGKWMSKAANFAPIAIKNGAAQWRYVVASLGAQVLAETVARGGSLSNSDIVLDSEVHSNDDLLYNLSFMTLETYLMTGVSTSMDSIKKRMAVCGAIAFVNSNVMNVAIKGQVDPKRNLLDTSWEVVISNSLIQADVEIMKKFTQLAQSKGNPKLKLVGYAIVFSNEFLNYYFYSKATQKYELSQKDLKKEMQLVPIWAKANETMK